MCPKFRSILGQFALALTLMVLPSLAFSQGFIHDGSYSLGYVVNSNARPDSLAVGLTEFYIQVVVPDTGRGTAAGMMTLRVSSPDGATWSQLKGEVTYGNYTSNNFNYKSADGAGSDSLKWSFYSLEPTEPVWLPGTTVIPLKVTLKISDASIGKTICLDDVDFWAPGDSTVFGDWSLVSWIPSWGGPYCFTITDCCQGLRGNFDGDFSAGPSVVDINKMVAYLLLGGPPPQCHSETDYNGNGNFEVSDLVGFLSWLFLGAPESVCPGN